MPVAPIDLTDFYTDFYTSPELREYRIMVDEYISRWSTVSSTSDVEYLSGSQWSNDIFDEVDAKTQPPPVGSAEVVELKEGWKLINGCLVRKGE